MKYEKLFSEGKIGNLTLKNRVIMPPMGTVLAGADGSVSDHQIAYYEERAAGGVGTIILEIVCVENELGRATATQLRGDEDRFIPGLSRLSQAIKKYGARVFAQIHHAGNQSNSQVTGGKQIVAPSPVTNKAVGEKPRALTTEEVKDLVRRFVDTARRMQQAGMDGVELHGAHGYLICQFLSPHTNRRTDEYGGSFENRMRFLDEIVQGIKEKCGSGFPLIVRFSADEFIEGGIDLEEGKRIARHLQSIGVNSLDVSSGAYESMPKILEPVFYPEGWRTYLAQTVKSEVSLPVITVGVIQRPATAEKILQEEKADFVAVGRGLLSDPEWLNKAAEGREEEITTCIGCLHCIETIFDACPIRCAVNPRTGRELEFPGFPRDGEGQKVAVVGGGPAGIEAAKVLALRGFRPVLYEKKQELGGQLVLGCRPPGKERIGWYKDALCAQLEAVGVEVHLGEEATPELLAGQDFFAAFIAIGGRSIVPSSIPGIDNPAVCSALDILEGTVTPEPGEQVVVIGGGMTGCETAEFLKHKGTEVTVVEMLPELVADEHPINKVTVVERLAEAGIQTLTGHTLVAVHPGNVELSEGKSEQTKQIPADRVVLALGLQAPEEEIVKWLRVNEWVNIIGDAVKPRRVAEAVRNAFESTYVLR